jgi:hypothetical protein
MAQLVLQYQDSDGCTYSCEVTLPVIYESAEALMVDFEEAMRAGLLSGAGEVMFAGFPFYPATFFYRDPATDTQVYDTPYIWTIDEWFANH